MSSNLKEGKTDLKGVAEQYLKFLPICSDIDNQTKFQFLELCKNLELNPFKKEIYLILNRQKNKGGEYINVFTPVVNYEFYRRRAEDFGDMDGGIDIKTETDSDTGLPIKSTATLYRQGKSHPYTKTIYFNEFAKKSLDGRLQAMWARMPIFMLEKVAEATLLRMAYPKEFRGVPYITEELNDGEMINVPKEETSEMEPEIKGEKVKPVVKEKVQEVIEGGVAEEIKVFSVTQKIGKSGRAYYTVIDNESNTYCSFDDKILDCESKIIKTFIKENEKNGRTTRIINSFEIVGEFEKEEIPF